MLRQLSELMLCFEEEDRDVTRKYGREELLCVVDQSNDGPLQVSFLLKGRDSHIFPSMLPFFSMPSRTCERYKFQKARIIAQSAALKAIPLALPDCGMPIFLVRLDTCCDPHGTFCGILRHIQQMTRLHCYDCIAVMRFMKRTYFGMYPPMYAHGDH